MVIIFCGIPGSGKSTIATLLAERLGALGQVRLLSSDRLKGPVYKKFLKLLGPAEEQADFVIFDATFVKKEWREQLAALAQSEVVTVYVQCRREVALARNRERRPNVSEKAVHIMFHRMEPPENPDVVIDSAATPAADAVEKIFELVKARRAAR